MEHLIAKLDVLEAIYNHQAAILNADADNHLHYFQVDLFIQKIWNETFEIPANSESKYNGFMSHWKIQLVRR